VQLSGRVWDVVLQPCSASHLPPPSANACSSTPAGAANPDAASASVPTAISNALKHIAVLTASTANTASFVHATHGQFQLPHLLVLQRQATLLIIYFTHVCMFLIHTIHCDVLPACSSSTARDSEEWHGHSNSTLTQPTSDRAVITPTSVSVYNFCCFLALHRARILTRLDFFGYEIQT
jgi:predicted secreted protein